MFCPFCKAEYRAGITHCSDCSFPLVDAIPKDDSDPNFMVLLWNGESLPFLEVVCKELDRAELSVATPRVEILLRDRADRYHLKHLSTFPYALGVFKRDFAAARKILELLAEKNLPPIALPPVAAYPEPFDERTTVAHRKGSAPLIATTTVYSSDDVRAMEFVEASLDGLDIPVRRVCLESGVYEIQVRPTSENAARRVIEEIASGTSSQLAALKLEDANLQDDGPQSYFLAWFLPMTYLFLVEAFAVADSTWMNGDADVVSLVLLGGIGSLLGMFWMIYQALHYEVRPFRYCVAALLPFTFVWYYVERYRLREGLQRLPVAMRVRMQPPQT